MTCLRFRAVVLAVCPVLAAVPALPSAPPRPVMAPFFEPNAGQTDPQARFLLRSGRGTFFFTGSEVVLAPSTGAPLRAQFLGAEPAVRVEGAEPRPGTVNYFVGADPKRWQAGLPTYAEVRYAGLYPGVDLAYRADGRPLKGTYTVAPGVDPAQIRWRYEGGEARVDEAGRLHVRTHGGDGTLTEEPPVAWQEDDGRRVPVSARFKAAADGSVGFVLGEYDRSRVLTIDPVIEYSTYLGGSIFDIAWSLAVDAAGNAYIAGYTASSNFPTMNAYQPGPAGQGDAFVAKFNPDGTPAYSTYLGGSYVDWATDIAVDAQGNAYVLGRTGSVNFPTAMAFQPNYAGFWDAFVTKLNPTGSALVYSTYLGGSGEENYTNAGHPGGIAVDAAGSAYVTGNTNSTNFPTKQAFQPNRNGPVDAFLTKFSANGTALVYSTYLGGESMDTGWAIAVDTRGRAVVTGETTSMSFPTKNAFQPNCHLPSAFGCWDVFVTTFTADGQGLAYSTYLGGDDQDWTDRGMGVAIDAAGTAHVTGWTGSPNFPVRNAYQSGYGGQIDAFVARFSRTGTLLSSTFLGGSNSDIGYGIAVQKAAPVGETSSLGVHVSGLTLSEDFPLVNPLQATLGQFEDPFVAKFNLRTDKLLFSTYFGGTDGREEYGSTGIALDGSGNVYITGGTAATDFPTKDPYQAAPHGSYDAFLTRFNADPQR